jgi:hypothetical protein
MAYVPGYVGPKSSMPHEWKNGPSIINGWHPTVIKPHNTPLRPAGIKRPPRF